jgi:hypothetical protein
MFLNAQTNCGNLIQNSDFDYIGNSNATTPISDLYDNNAYTVHLQAYSEGLVPNWFESIAHPDAFIGSGINGTDCLFLLCGPLASPPRQEAVRQVLASPLVANRNYAISFFGRKTRNGIGSLRIRFSNNTNFNTNFQELPLQEIAETNIGVFVRYRICFTASGNWSNIQLCNTFNEETDGIGTGIMIDEFEMYNFNNNDIALTLTNNSNPSGSICTNDNFTISESCFSALTNSPFTFQWFERIGTNFVALPGQTNPTLTLTRPPGSHTFRLRISNGTNCTIFRNLTLTVFNPQTISITSPSSVCQGDPVTLNANPTGFTSYNWTIGSSTTSIGSSSSLTHTPISSPTTYNLAVVDDNGCRNSASRTITFNPNDCECGTLIGQNGLLSGTYSNQVYRINNNVQINSNTSFINCEVKVSPGVTITVNSRLSIRGSHFFACSNMWNGFNITNAGSMSVTDYVIPSSGQTRNSLIEDAYFAIQASANNLNSNAISIRNTIFNRNQNAIQLSNQISNNFYALTKIENCVFTSRTMNVSAFNVNTNSWPTIVQLKTAYNPEPGNPHSAQQINPLTYFPISLKNPLNNQYPIGIRLTNVGDEIKSLTIGEGNLFDFQVNAINSTNSSFTISNSNFQNSFSQSEFDGIGISAREVRNNLSYVNKIKVTNCKFIELHRAMEFSKIKDLLITSNEIISNQKENNYINQISTLYHRGKYGIINRIAISYEHIIQNNIIYNIEQAVVCFGEFANVSNVPFQGWRNLSINGNLIQNNKNQQNTGFVRDAIVVTTPFNPTFTGILQDTRRINITNNIIKNVYRGIRVNGWQKNNILITDNSEIRLKKSVVQSDAQYGIDFYQNNPTYSYSLISSNNIYGFNVNLNNISRNDGIAIKTSDKFGVTCNLTDKVHQGIYLSGQLDQSRIIRNTMNQDFYGLVLDNNALLSIGALGKINNPSKNIFSNFTSGTFQTLAKNLSNTTLPENNMWVTNGANEIPNMNSFQFNGVSFQLNSSIFITSGQPFPCNVAEPIPPNDPSLLGRMKKIVQDEIPIGGENAEIKKFIAKQHVYSALKENPQLMENEHILQVFFNENDGGNMGKINKIENKINEGKVLEAQIELNSFDTQLEAEANEKIYFEKALKYLDESLNEQDSVELFELAAKCYAWNGLAVLKARALYANKYGIDYVFVDFCDESVDNQEFIIENEEEIEVYPNPSNGKIYFNSKNLNNFIIKDIYDKEIEFKINPINDVIEIELENYTKYSMIIIKMNNKNGKEYYKKVFVH